jgi:hypothetical protein
LGIYNETVPVGLDTRSEPRRDRADPNLPSENNAELNVPMKP